MKSLLPLTLAAAVALSCSSCYYYTPAPYTKRGTVFGGLAGAGAGGIIGHQSGRGLEGAAIGGAIGALAGGLLGNARDDYYRRQAYYGGSPYGGYGTSYQYGSSYAYPASPAYVYAPPPPPIYLGSLNLGYGGYGGGYRGGYCRPRGGYGFNLGYSSPIFRSYGGYGGYGHRSHRRHCY